MRIAISSTGKDLESQVDVRFGRCSYFIIAEVEGKEIKSSESIENTSAAQMGGAGITAAQMVADKKVDAIITGNMGPRAFTVFQQLGIEIHLSVPVWIWICYELQVESEGVIPASIGIVVVIFRLRRGFVCAIPP